MSYFLKTKFKYSDILLGYTLYCVTPICRKQKRFSRLHTLFCVKCLAGRIGKIMEEEEEEEVNSIRYKNSTFNLNKINLNYSDKIDIYSNIKLMDDYLLERLEIENPTRNQSLKNKK